MKSLKRKNNQKVSNEISNLLKKDRIENANTLAAVKGGSRSSVSCWCETHKVIKDAPIEAR